MSRPTGRPPGRPKGSGTGTSTAPGECEKCGRAKVWKGDSRRAEGGYYTCKHGKASTKRPRKAGPRRPRRPADVNAGKTAAPKPQARVGTQEWLTDPSVPVCSHDECWFDRKTCPVHGRK